MDGTALTGRILSETGNSLTLVAADGQARTILRDQVETLRGSALSLMPEGLETGLTPQQAADIIAYVREGLE